MRGSRKRSLLPFPFVFATIVLTVIALTLFVYQTLQDGKEVNLSKTVAVYSSLDESSEEKFIKKSESVTEEQDMAEKQNTAEGQNVSEKHPTAEEKAVTFFESKNNVEEKVNDLVENMTLREKIGQLMVVGFQSKQIDQHIKTMMTEYHVGGVILYDRNMETPDQVASLNNQLQDLALKNKHQIPLMVSIDQEGGKIVRMRDQVSPIPSQQELGQKADSKEVYHVAYRNGKELAAMGIHVNFAPVLDLSASDSRSFGTEPEKANTLGSQVVTGLTDSGIVATLKHFPGNGRSNIDPHVETSSVQANQWDLENKDMYPFKKIIENIDNNRFFVMVTHIKYPAYDKENPASISPIIIQELLRKKLGYKGVVVTDDLEMGAVNKYFTYEDLGYKAVESGADLLLVCHTLENQKKVFNGILEAVQTKKLSEERIDEAVKRILTNKLTSIKSTHVDPIQAKKIVGK
jgi:beta-N-acetylhexosaminidase